MKLSLFLNGLLADGNVVVPRTLVTFEAGDLDAAGLLLQDLYERDCLEMPYDCPEFDRNAALWAAGYAFRVCQFILLRDIGEAEMNRWLHAYEGLQSAGVIYSTDLMLRFLPDLFRLASGISPEDPLIYNMKATAIQWPFSSIGIPGVTDTDLTVIWQNQSLRYAYIDRLILRKEMQRLRGENEIELLKEILGANQAALWPGLELIHYDTR